MYIADMRTYASKNKTDQTPSGYEALMLLTKHVPPTDEHRAQGLQGTDGNRRRHLHGPRAPVLLVGDEVCGTRKLVYSARHRAGIRIK